MTDLDRDRLLHILHMMWRIRIFDTRIVELFSAGRISGALHSYVGEEAVAAGVCAALRPDDYITSTHRGHGHVIAKGADLNRMMAELFARETGYCRAKGGSMHICDFSLGILGANGIVGAGAPIAAGAGTAVKMRGGDQVVVCFFGDGAANHGAVHEGMNIAATWDLPVIFVCENNGYAQFTPQRMHAKVADLFLRASGYGIPGVAVDGNDALAVYEATAAAARRARAGEGPTLIEAKTFRWFGHAINNPASNLGRDPDEINAWKARDPIPRFERILLERGVITEAEARAIEQEERDAVEAAIAFAEASPPPPLESALEDVYTVLPAGVRL